MARLCLVLLLVAAVLGGCSTGAREPAPPAPAPTLSPPTTLASALPRQVGPPSIQSLPGTGAVRTDQPSAGTPEHRLLTAMASAPRSPGSARHRRYLHPGLLTEGKDHLSAGHALVQFVATLVRPPSPMAVRLR
jgi:hypothetical protein